MSQSMFIYTWNIDERESNITAIQIFGITESRETVCLRVNDFTPFVYVELPLINGNDHFWTRETSQKVANIIDDKMRDNRPLRKKFVKKEKLYYANFNSDGSRKLYPYLFLTFSTKSDMKQLFYTLKNPIYVCGRMIQFVIHEQAADPILQLTSTINIHNTGWITFKGKVEDKISYCTHEYVVKYQDITGDPTNTKMVKPTIMSYDIETYSTVNSTMSSVDRPGDRIFQISCILSISGENPDFASKYLLALGEPSQDKVGSDVTIISFQTETALICGFSEFVIEHNPHIIIGYNILKFDIMYMIGRAKHTHSFNVFSKQGMLKDVNSKLKEIKWSSSAFKNQEFYFLNVEGRLFIDLLPIIQTEHRLNDYKLKTVSDHFIGDTKDPLTIQGVFKCYRLGLLNNQGSVKGNNALGVVGKYCVQDSFLVTKLFEKLQIWISLTEMSRTFNIPIIKLLTGGQQIKVYSQIYKKCMKDNIVVEQNVYKMGDNDHYQGATVFDPIPGVYEKVLPFDFASLYPSTIIAYNIDYSTFVVDNSIPDDSCHIIEFEDHIGCTHDTVKHKSKPKHILCAHHRYRFIKSPRGVIPNILQNLLDARATTRAELKRIKTEVQNETDVEEKKRKQEYCNILDKRQLAYKVSANSMYGAMGVVTKGYLPFMIGAMCTTAMGRKSFELVAKVITEQYGGTLIYGDTDSNYVSFPHLTTAEECWTHAEYVATEISKLFPDPMNLVFENVIYWRFLILTKKRYMSIACGRDGIVREKLETKGVLLVRRDNSLLVRELYGVIIKKIFERESITTIITYFTDQLQLMFSNSLSPSSFVITKSIGDHGNLTPVPFINEKNVPKLQVGNYTINRITDREHQFKLKNCSNEQEYYLHSLPAQIQLAERMRSRGQRVEIGSRVEFVVTIGTGHKSKQCTKLESYDYFLNHKSIIPLDFLYYLKSIMNPLDQVFNIVMNEKNIVKKLYDSRVHFSKVLIELNQQYSPRFIFEK